MQTGDRLSETLEMLREDNAGALKAPYPENAYFLQNTSGLKDLKAFRHGGLFVQDISSQLAVYAAGIKEGSRVLDVCAAPGGKSLLAADILKGTGSVLARDISEDKVRLINENIQRLGLENIRAEVFDAEVFDSASEGRYDTVIADLPCSGWGVIGRKPDIKYSASREKEEQLAELQYRILENACRYVRPGGTLIYSTCTVSEAENEGNAERFLAGHPDFSPVSLNPLLPEELRCESAEKGYLQILPDDIKDGFFIARFANGHPVNV